MWAERIRTRGATRVWAYGNNDRDELAIKNARTLRRQLRGSIPRPRRKRDGNAGSQ